jgi:hypothetical protein
METRRVREISGGSIPGGTAWSASLAKPVVELLLFPAIPFNRRRRRLGVDHGFHLTAFLATLEICRLGCVRLNRFPLTGFFEDAKFPRHPFTYDFRFQPVRILGPGNSREASLAHGSAGLLQARESTLNLRQFLETRLQL